MDNVQIFWLDKHLYSLIYDFEQIIYSPQAIIFSFINGIIKVILCHDDLRIYTYTHTHTRTQIYPSYVSSYVSAYIRTHIHTLNCRLETHRLCNIDYLWVVDMLIFYFLPYTFL